MASLVGTPHDEVLTLRDAFLSLVSGASVVATYAARQDGVPFAVSGLVESPAGSGTYPLAFTPTAPMAHHLWVTATAAGFLAHYRRTVWAVGAALPIAHVVGQPQEEVLVLLDPAGVPIAGAFFAVVPGSVVAPADDAFAPVVANHPPVPGVYFARWTPLVAGYRRCELATTNTTPVQRFVVEYEAFPAGPPLPQPVSDRAGTGAWLDVVPPGAIAWVQE